MDPSEGNLLVAQVCDDVHSLYQKTEKLKAIWKNVEDTNMVLNNRIAHLQKEINELHEQLDQKTIKDTKRKTEVKVLQEKVEKLQTESKELQEELAEFRELREKLKVPSKTLALLKLRTFLGQIQTLMYERIFPDEYKKVYTLEDLKSRLTQKNQKQYDEMISELRLREDSIPRTIKYMMRSYDLKYLNPPLLKDVREDIAAGITNMTDFEKIFKESEISPDDIKSCKQLAEAYLHLKTITP